MSSITSYPDLPSHSKFLFISFSHLIDVPILLSHLVTPNYKVTLYNPLPSKVHNLLSRGTKSVNMCRTLTVGTDGNKKSSNKYNKYIVRLSEPFVSVIVSLKRTLSQVTHIFTVERGPVGQSYPLNPFTIVRPKTITVLIISGDTGYVLRTQ